MEEDAAISASSEHESGSGASDASDEEGGPQVESQDACQEAAAEGGRSKQSRAPPCAVCSQPAARWWSTCPQCGSRAHIECLAQQFAGVRWGVESRVRQPMVWQGDARGMPQGGPCPACGARRRWMEVLETLSNAGWTGNRRRRQRKGSGWGVVHAACSSSRHCTWHRSPVKPEGRGRGRPKGSTKSAAAAAASKDPPSPPGVQKKRGTPRKKVVSSSASQQQVAAVAEHELPLAERLALRLKRAAAAAPPPQPSKEVIVLDTDSDECVGTVVQDDVPLQAGRGKRTRCGVFWGSCM